MTSESHESGETEAEASSASPELSDPTGSAWRDGTGDAQSARSPESESAGSEAGDGCDTDRVLSPPVAMTRGEAAAMAPRRGVDSDELVGPGGYELRIQPAAALIPGRGDSRRLMAVWFVRKSFYWMFFVAWSCASWIAYRNGDAIDTELDLTSLQSSGEGLGTPGRALLVAIGIRFVNNWIALALAYPLAVAHEPSLSPRENFGSGIGKFFDRLHVARAFRALRWTHHVRRIALDRLGSSGRKLGRLDPILDVVNVASGVGAFVLVGILGSLSGT